MKSGFKIFHIVKMKFIFAFIEFEPNFFILIPNCADAFHIDIGKPTNPKKN